MRGKWISISRDSRPLVSSAFTRLWRALNAPLKREMRAYSLNYCRKMITCCSKRVLLEIKYYDREASKTSMNYYAYAFFGHLWGHSNFMVYPISMRQPLISLLATDQRRIVITTHVAELNAALTRLRLPVPFFSPRIYDLVTEEMS